MAETQDKKPDISSGGVEHINIKVRGQGGDEIQFKLKKTTPLKKLMTAYCERQGKAPNSVRFLYDGQRIDGELTPQDFNMEDDDIIDAELEQIGGSKLIRHEN